MKDELLRVLLLQLILIILVATGCNPLSHDQDQSVTIEISPITNSSDRQEVLGILEGMVGQTSHTTIRIQSDSDSMRITLSPVDDVQAFAGRITFGRVKDIRDRIIIVEYQGEKIFI